MSANDRHLPSLAYSLLTRHRDVSQSAREGSVSQWLGLSTKLVLLANVASTLMLVGLIWFVQVVHYPQFARVGADSFPQYQSEHVRLTKWVVALPMLVEAATSAVLAWR